jgi:hydrogenase maturation factor
VHVGFALEVVDEAEAKQIFTFLEGMNELGELQTESEV